MTSLSRASCGLAQRIASGASSLLALPRTALRRCAHFVAIPCQFKPFRVGSSHSVSVQATPFQLASIPVSFSHSSSQSLSNPLLPLPALSSDSMPFPVIPCHSMPFPVTPCHSMPFPVSPCHSMSFHAVPCHSMPFPVIPCHSLSFHVIPCHSLSFRAIPVAPCHGSKSPSFHFLPPRPSLPPKSSPHPQQASNDSAALHPSELPSLNTKPTAAASTSIPTPPTPPPPSLSSRLPSALPRSVLLPLLAAAIAAATFFSSLSWRLGGGGGAPFAALLRPPPAAAASNQIVLTPPPPGTASPAALKSPQQRAGITDKALYAIDLFLTTEPSGKLLLLSVLWVALMLLGAGAFIAAAKATNEDVPFGEAVWVSWTMLSDPGQQGAQDSIWKRVLSVVLTIKGLLLLALLVGLATDGVAKQVDDLNKGKGAVMERGHVLVVGWTPRTIPLVQQLVGADGSRAVVVLAGGKGKEEMDSALLDAIPKSERQKAGGGQIVTRTGSPFHSEDLARCAADAARSIVLLSPPVSDPSQADAFVIQASLALANRPDISADIIAELSSLSNVRLLQRLHRTLLAPSPSFTAATAQAPATSTRGSAATASMRGRRRRLVPVAAENLSLRTLLSAAVHRGTADVTTDLLDFENDEFYFKEWPELVGRTFGDALFLFDNATPCGLMKAPRQHAAPDASGAGSTMGEVLVNPPSWTLIECHPLWAHEVPQAAQPARCLHCQQHYWRGACEPAQLDAHRVMLPARAPHTPHAAATALGAAGSTMGEVLVNPPSWTLIEVRPQRIPRCIPPSSPHPLPSSWPPSAASLPSPPPLVITADSNSYPKGPSYVPSPSSFSSLPLPPTPKPPNPSPFCQPGDKLLVIPADRNSYRPGPSRLLWCSSPSFPTSSSYIPPPPLPPSSARGQAPGDCSGSQQLPPGTQPPATPAFRAHCCSCPGSHSESATWHEQQQRGRQAACAYMRVAAGSKAAGGAAALDTGTRQ
ncbi:unnamed protein product [Closterium sp. NIES-54]